MDVKLVERVAGSAKPEDLVEAEKILQEVTAGRYRLDGPTISTRAGAITIDLVAALALSRLETIQAAGGDEGRT